MHRVESDNVGVDSQGRNIFVDGPPGTTVNAAIMNAMMEEICNVIEGYGLNLKTKLTDNAHTQLWSVIQSTIDKNGRTATWIFASSDSSAKSQAGADTIISTAQDAAAIIQAKATELSAAGGGKIVCLEGTYNFSTSLVMQSYCNIEGNGYHTIFKRNASIANVIDASSAVVYVLSDFRIDGNKATYAIGNGILGNASYYNNAHIGIRSSNNHVYGFSTCNRISNCGAVSNGTDGFYTCSVLEDCYSQINTNDGFSTCEQLSNCYASGNGNMGFISCEQASNCYSTGNSHSGYNSSNKLSNCVSYNNTLFGYGNCDQLSGCHSSLDAAGFNQCEVLSSCVAYSCTGFGFTSCLYMSSCHSTYNGYDGFESCFNLSNCVSKWNDDCGFRDCHHIGFCYGKNNAASAWPFTSCTGMGQCRGAGGGSAWRSCYVDYAGTVLISNGAVGGYNYE